MRSRILLGSCGFNAISLLFILGYKIPIIRADGLGRFLTAGMDNNSTTSNSSSSSNNDEEQALVVIQCAMGCTLEFLHTNEWEEVG